MRYLSNIILYAKKNALMIVLLFATLFFMVGSRVYFNNYFYGKYHVDEYHVVYEGLNLIANGQVSNFRAQEGVRWLVRFSYPYALLKSSTTMGGNVWATGWDYPGHNYIIENYVKEYDHSINNVRYDPNLRDFMHNLRIPYILFVALSFFVLGWVLIKKGYPITGIGLVALLGLNRGLIKEQWYFYIEPGLLAMINFITAAYIHYTRDREALNYKHALFFGFLFAFLMSVKFSGLFYIFLPLLLIYWYSKNKKESIKNLTLFVVSGGVSYVVINFPAFVDLGHFNQFLHDFVSNFWQYASGSSHKYTIGPGGAHLKTVLLQFIGAFIYLIPVLVVAAWKWGDRNFRRTVTPLLVIVLISMLSLSSQHIYFERNTIPFYGSLALLLLLPLDVLFKKYWRKPKKSTVATGLLVILVGAVLMGARISNQVSQLALTPKKGFEKNVQIVTARFADGQVYAMGIDGVQNAIKLENAPIPLHNKNYEEFESSLAELPEDAIVLVRRVGNNNHATNYVLPKYYNRNHQNGSYFVFYNEPEQL